MSTVRATAPHGARATTTHRFRGPARPRGRVPCCNLLRLRILSFPAAEAAPVSFAFFLIEILEFQRRRADPDSHPLSA
jgi:hypothetical protein